MATPTNTAEQTQQRQKGRDFIAGHVGRGVEEMMTTLSQHGINQDEFKGAMIEALLAQPKLLNAEVGSLYQAIRKCCQDGLLPNGTDATIHTKRSKDKDGNWRDVAVYLPMRDGLLRIMYETLGAEIETGHILASEADSVAIWEGTEDWKIAVKKNLVQVEGDRVVGAWAVARIPGRRPVHVLMNEQELAEAMSKSAAYNATSEDGKDSPWGNKKTGALGWRGKQSEKTAAKSLANKLKHRVTKKNLRIHNVLANDDEFLTLEAETTSAAAAVEAQPAPKQIAQQPVQTLPVTPAPEPATTPAATTPAEPTESAPLPGGTGGEPQQQSMLAPPPAL